MNTNIIEYNKNLILFFIKIIIIITCLSFYINFIKIFKFLLIILESQSEFIKNEKLFKLSNYKLKILKKFRKTNNPKVSIISPVFNSEKFILRFLRSIQNQNFNELEIILIDDFSIDNSIEIIQNYKSKDERIILLKNKINKGTFINRNLGVLYSKGKYIILPDPDDILTNSIIYFCYRYATKYKIEMIRFNLYLGKKLTDFNYITKQIRSRLINQPELSTYIFYGNNELQRTDCFITNKFIRKDVYIKALNSLNNFYFNMHIKYMEDSIINYIIYRTAKSFIFLKKIGYYYIKTSQSISCNLFKFITLRIKYIFILLKIFFEYSKNTKYEKDISNYLFSSLFNNKDFKLNKKLSIFNKDFYFYFNIIKLFLNSSYINSENKIFLFQIKNNFYLKN